VSPTRRRESVRHLRRTFEVSERRACRAIGQPRSSQRYAATSSQFVQRLIATMHELVRKFPRYGYRTITKLLRRLGFAVNPKRIYRLWRQEGLKVPRKPRRRRYPGSKEGGIVQQPSQGPNDVWAWDFLFSRDEAGRLIKWLILIDEYTRECLLLEPSRSMTAADLRDRFAEVMRDRGVPRRVRSDNGPEFVASRLREFLGLIGSGATFIEPGAPWENGFAESFNSRVRDTLLNVELLADLAEAKEAARRWKDHYNLDRPHTSLGDLTPAEFAALASSAGPSGAPPLPAQQRTRGTKELVGLS